MAHSSRWLAQADRHYRELEALGAESGPVAYHQLKKIERVARYWTIQASNIPIERETLEKKWEAIEDRVRSVFGGKLPQGFFINKDPRGHALKIDQDDILPERRISHTDWGSNGILAADFEE